ncbi:MAG: muconolactone Delta-isomerase family protein [Candidatus Kariarchaeaceae archaeon]
MRFLVIYAYHSDPPMDVYEELVRETNAMILEQKAAGQIECAYQMIPTGTMVVYNVATHDDLLELLTNGPLLPYLSRDITPLSESDQPFQLDVD